MRHRILRQPHTGLVDPLLRPLFGKGKAEHVDHLTAFTAESFGGPDRFSRELGFAHLIAVHRGLRISEAQRARFVGLYMAALDAAEMPSDPAFREAVREHTALESMHYLDGIACIRGYYRTLGPDAARDFAPEMGRWPEAESLMPSAPRWMDAAAGVVAAFALTVLFYGYQRLRFSEIDVRCRERMGK